VWVAIAMSSVALLGLLVAGAAALVYFSGEFDQTEPGDYTVTQGAVEEAVAGPCDTMARSTRHIQILGPADEGASQLRDFTRAAGDVVKAIDGAGPDRDSRAWRKDWTTLIEAIDDFAGRIEDDPYAEFEMPGTSDGYALSERMYWGSPEGCEVPIVIEALDPFNAAQYYTPGE
jgi:hypothetical protein